MDLSSLSLRHVKVKGAGGRSTSLLGSVRGVKSGRHRAWREPLFADQTSINCPTGFDKR
jgi:hypothetical protein